MSPVILLNNFANQGFTRSGFEDGAAVGSEVTGAGDVNGDGFDDVFVGAPLTSASPTFRGGAAYVVFGGSTLTGTIVTPNAMGSGGFTLRGFETNSLDVQPGPGFPNPAVTATTPRAVRR